jgi:hypothetical protein
MTEITMPFVRCNSGQITWTVEVCSLERFMTPQLESTVVYNTKLASAGSRSIDVVVESVRRGHPDLFVRPESIPFLPQSR